MVKIILRKFREESMKRFHPWVYSGAVAQVVGTPMEGDLVSVCSSTGEFLALGHFQLGPICVRVLSFDSDVLKPDFWEIMITRALEVRKTEGFPSDSCYRLVNGEGDNLPGLTIDHFDGVCLFKAHSVGMYRSRKQIVEALKVIYGDSLKAVYDQTSGTVLERAVNASPNGYLYTCEGFSDEVQVAVENGLKFIINWTEGKNAGFSLDLREGRNLVRKYAQGRNVLSLFSGAGGFAISALAGGAGHVDSVDSSQRSLKLAGQNAVLNGIDPSAQSTFCCDPFEYLKEAPENTYDLMVINPPAFAKHKGSFNNAMKAYQKLNSYAISKIRTGGLIFTYSCSNVVDRENFSKAIFNAAVRSGRSVRILGHLSQPADHSVNIYHPEGEYLKGLLLYVE